MKKLILFFLSIVFAMHAPTFIFASDTKNTATEIEETEEKKRPLDAVIYDFLSEEDYSYIYFKEDEKTGKGITHIVPYHTRAVEEALKEAKKVANNEVEVVIDSVRGEYSYQQLLDAGNILFDKVLGKYGYVRAVAIGSDKLEIMLYEGEEWTEGRKNKMRSITGMKEIIFTTHEESVKRVEEAMNSKCEEEEPEEQEEQEEK